MTPPTVQLGDWLALAPKLAAASIDFLYSDPPFNTGREHRTPPGAGKRITSSSLVPHASSLVPSSFSDLFESTSAYIAWLRERLHASRPALKPSALVAIHCDFRTSHHVRMMLDELFGTDHFVNHLIWHYGLGGSSPRRFARKHDDILVYCLDQERYYFDPPLVPATSQRLKGKMKKATDVLRVAQDVHGGAPSDTPSRMIDDVLDIASLNNMSHERTGYPTQKPRALLDLLVRAFCPAGGMVLDPTCGSGTTMVAAIAAGREATGFDANPDAVEIARRRLAQAVGAC
jgi:site-specific DNA-methyltransferase (adenine-specific)